ncbi:hypothetical protein RFI_13629 [Reticulomyxa filosa]|uniref:Uncharacterized protein n=1 Tax=Reticulomyxa filosa TaxID=46433 RepID=X6NC04_RETFI|nr:hypothetical protein RFI_13629 [Reticulomyxa filosa]|eukprot:ETO23551.1 hypothetical protein RFI_13629 [Reticulomyxa filosa]
MATDTQEQAFGPMEAEKMEIIEEDMLDILILEKEREWLAQPFQPYYNMAEEDDERAEASIEFKKQGREQIMKMRGEEIKDICKKYWIENEESRKQDFDEEELEYSVNQVKKRQWENDSKMEHSKHEYHRVLDRMEKDMGKAKKKIEEILTTICYKRPDISSQWQWYKTLQEIEEYDEVSIMLGIKTQSRVWVGRIYNDEGYRYYMKCKKNQGVEDIPEIDLLITSNGYITRNNELINIEDTMISRMVESMLNKKQLVTSRIMAIYHKWLDEEEGKEEN